MFVTAQYSFFLTYYAKKYILILSSDKRDILRRQNRNQMITTITVNQGSRIKNICLVMHFNGFSLRACRWFEIISPPRFRKRKKFKCKKHTLISCFHFKLFRKLTSVDAKVYTVRKNPKKFLVGNGIFISVSYRKFF